MHDVIVTDEEYRNSAVSIVRTANAIDTMISRYLNIMNEAKNAGAVSGEIANALSSYIEYASCLRNAASQIASYYGQVSRRFLTSIDSADEYLY